LFSTTGKMMALHNGAVKTFWPSLKFMETLEWECTKSFNNYCTKISWI
jgi:hypothetical protein